MLVLTRKINESITIGDDITIMLVDIRGDKCRLDISAPRSVPIHREEVQRQIDAGIPGRRLARRARR